MSRRAPRGRPRSPRPRLFVEWLEDRTQPATVTSTADAGPGSLRDAIVNSFPGEFIDFVLPLGPNVITLTTGQLVIPHTLTIIGPGADQLVVSGNNASRVFHVIGSEVRIEGLTVADGRVASPEVGGAILNEGSIVALFDVVVRDSRVDTVAGDANGGGIYNTFSGLLSLNHTTIFSNAADYGGGLYNDGSLFSANLTLSGNTARVFGGGLQNWGTAGLDYATVAGNTGIGVQASGGAVTYRNTLFAANAGGNVVSFGGQLTSNGNNLSSDATGNLTAPGDLPNTNPRLGPLGNYGGGVPTHALYPGSPAIDAAAQGGETDARGVGRFTDGDGDGTFGPDVGAFEVPVYTVTTTSDFTDGSLRAAIDLNNQLGGGRFDFVIDVSGVATFRPAGAALPPILQPAFLDGWSQGGPGYTGPPLVELDGGGFAPGVGANGLSIQSPGVVVRGLAVNNFPTNPAGSGFSAGGYGIVVQTFGGPSPSVWLHGNTVGTDPTGTAAEPNARGGIYVDGNVSFLLANPPADVLIGTNADGIDDAASGT